MTRTSIRLAIIANQRTLLEGAELWFGRDGMEADLIIVESRWSGFMVAAFDITPDVVILDMSMDDKNSVAMKLGALKHLGVRVLLTGDRPPVEVVRSALEAGAAGFVCRTAGFAVMAEAVMEVDSGRRYVSAAMSASLAKQVSKCCNLGLPSCTAAIKSGKS